MWPGLGALDVSDVEFESQAKILMLETSNEHLRRWRELGYCHPSFQVEKTVCQMKPAWLGR